MGQVVGHHAFVLKEMETVQQGGEVGGGLWGEAVAFESHRETRGIPLFESLAEGLVPRWKALHLWLKTAGCGDRYAGLVSR